MIHHIQESCGHSSVKNKPTILFEDNAACIAQIKGGYIKGDRIKHISPKCFYTHELQQNGEIDVQQIRSSDNQVDLFTKALSTSTFKKLIYKVGIVINFAESELEFREREFQTEKRERDFREFFSSDFQ